MRRALLVALLLVAGCSRPGPAGLLPQTPAGYQEVSDIGFWLVAPQRWQVLDEDQRQPRFAAEVVGPERTAGFAPRVGLLLDERTRWQTLAQLASAFDAGALDDAGATVVRDEHVGGMGADARLIESSYRQHRGPTTTVVRQYDLLMVVDGLGVDLRVAAAAADFDEDVARTIVTSLRLRQTVEAAGRQAYGHPPEG